MLEPGSSWTCGFGLPSGCLVLGQSPWLVLAGDL